MKPSYSPSANEIESYANKTGISKTEAKRYLEIENLKGLVANPETDIDLLREVIFYILDNMK